MTKVYPRAVRVDQIIKCLFFINNPIFHSFEAGNCVSNSSLKWMKNTHKQFCSTRVNWKYLKLDPVHSTGWLVSTVVGPTVPVMMISSCISMCVFGNRSTVSHVKSLIAEHGSDCWWTLPVEKLLPQHVLLEVFNAFFSILISIHLFWCYYHSKISIWPQLLFNWFHHIIHSQSLQNMYTCSYQ